MAAPGRINVNYNAADAIEQARRSGLEDPRVGEAITPRELSDILTGTPGRPVRLIGWHALGTSLLKIEPDQAEGGTLRVSSLDEPPFEADYLVSDNPPPEVIVHGDIFFALERASEGERD